MKTKTIAINTGIGLITAAILLSGAAAFAQNTTSSPTTSATISQEQLTEITAAMREHDHTKVEQLLSEYGLTFQDVRQAIGGGHGHGGMSEEVKAALEAKDYAAFQAALPDQSPLKTLIDTPEKFDQFIQLHEARQSGDTETAQKIATELGLPEFGKMHDHEKGFMNKFSEEQKAALKTAIDNGDYAAWLQIVGSDSKMAANITAENFHLLKDLETARQNDDHETAKSIMDELGMKPPMGHGHSGRGFGRGMRH